MTACAAPSKLAGQVAGERHLPGQRLGEHVVRHRQRLLDQPGDRRGLHGGQRLGAGRGLAEDDGGARRAEGVGQRGAGVEAGLPAARHASRG